MSCYPSTPCDEANSFFCGTTFEDADAECSIPCPTGRSKTCPQGMGCFAYTLCNEDGTNAVPTGAFTPVTAPLDSHYCGTSFSDATSTCQKACPSGKSDECPGDLLCFAGTSCEASDSFFCGTTWEEAAGTCTKPCGGGLDTECDTGAGEKCFGYTPCNNDHTFYCGTTFDDASTNCGQACPSGLDSECPARMTCHKCATCADGVPSYSAVPSTAPAGMYYCGFDFKDASTSCADPCPSSSSVECLVGMACFDHTTCSMEDTDTYFCGVSLWEANMNCA